MGGYVSFSGILTFPKSTENRDIARDVPADRLLVETDCALPRARAASAASATNPPTSPAPRRCWRRCAA